MDVSERETRENAWRKRTENARLLTVVLARAPKLMHAYNPLLDEVSHGAKQTKVWEEYKAERTARETENVDDEAAGSDSRCAHREKKAYGKHYPSVWTKDPHGGEYRVDKGPGSRKGYDALEQQSDGRMIERPLGYEKPQTGPTTNFVGNHMTQGAIDLVQYELTKIDPDQEVNRDRLDQARGVQRKPPELISTAKTNQSDKVSRIENFTWWDAGEVVHIQIDRKSLLEARYRETSCEFNERSLTVKVPRFATSSQPRHTFVLQLRRLYAPVRVGESSFIITPDNLQVDLVKVDVSESWERLEEPPPKTLSSKSTLNSAVVPQHDLDLHALRTRLITQREGKMSESMQWLKMSHQKQSDVENEKIMCSTETRNCVPAYFERGDYATVLLYTSHALHDGENSSQSRYELLHYQARANIQLGALKNAVCNYTNMLEIRSSAEVLKQRGRIYEQLEKYGEALRDYIAALDSNRNDSTLHQAIRRVRGLACEEDRKQAKAEQDNVFRSVPRPCLPQFENRGKAGACF